MKQGRGEKGLASLVSHIHSKINNTSSDWKNQENHPDDENVSSQRSLGIHLSPMTNNMATEASSREECHVSHLMSRSKTKPSKKSKSGTSRSQTDTVVAADHRKANRSNKVTELKKSAAPYSKTSPSLPTKQPTISKKKASISNDWLFDDQDMSIN